MTFGFRANCRVSRCAVAGLALYCLGVSMALAAPKMFKQVLGGEYQEQIDPAVPVSGLALVGLALAGPIDLDAKVLHVFLAKPFDGRLSLEMTSANGRFRAHAMYEGRSDGNEWIALSIDPRDADKSARAQLKRNPTELAVAVRPVTSGGTVMDTVLQVSWGDLPASQSDRNLRLHVNSRRAEIFVRAPGMQKAMSCTQLRIPTAIRFDSVCEVTWRPSLSGQLQLIRRDGFDESLQKVLVY